MNKTIMGALVGASVVLGGVSAHAQSALADPHSYTSLFGTNPTYNAATNSGQWDVILSRTGSDYLNWSVTVNTKKLNGTPSTTAPTNGNVYFKTLDQLEVNFGGQFFDFTGINTPWSTTASVTKNFVLASAPTGATTNVSYGLISLANVSNTPENGARRAWTASTTAVTPEMPGSVLAMASMLPLVGGVLIRRRGKGSRKTA